MNPDCTCDAHRFDGRHIPGCPQHFEPREEPLIEEARKAVEPAPIITAIITPTFTLGDLT